MSGANAELSCALGVIFQRKNIMAVNQIERAFRAWPILVKIAAERRTITYKELGAALGVHHRPIRYVLDVIQNYCLEIDLPPLTILVVNSSGKPGAGFVAYDLSLLELGLETVWNYDWDSHENPFGFAANGDSYKTLINALINNPECSDEVYAKVKTRGVKQILFRDTLLKAYGKKCAFTELSFKGALEACHIVPWAQSTDHERLDVRNGILLNSIHHKLFDQGLITITTDYKILYVDPKAEDGPYSKIDRALTTKLHGKIMHYPKMIKNRPLSEYVDKHNEIVGFEY